MKSDATMKLLIVSADPRLTLGYSKVIQKIANYMASKDVEIVMYTVNFDKQKVLPNVFIDPRIKIAPVKDPHSFGFDTFREFVDKEKPDSIFIYADTTTVYNYVTSLDTSSKIYVYLDICQRWSDTLVLQKLNDRVHHWFTFLNCWTRHLVDDIKFDESKVSTIEHGINFDELKQVDIVKEKKEFIVLNMNRNTIRKNWAVTISGFIEFLSRHDYDPSIRLYVSCGTNDCDQHCNIEKHVYMEFFKRGLDYMKYTNHFILNTKPLQLSKDEINKLYSECDVGINTCMAEGFGLSPIEHAYFNKPQILTDIPTFRDTMGDDAILVKPSLTYMYTGKNELNGERTMVDASDVADALDICYSKKHSTNTRETVFKRFSWINIYKQLDHMITILNNGPL